MKVSQGMSVVAGALTLALGISLAAASAPPAEAAWSASGADPENPSAIQGVVARSGVPVRGADVLVVAWPTQEVLDKLTDGEQVPTYSVANVKTDAAGRYAVPLDLASLPADVATEDGQVDVDIIVADKKSEMQWGVSLLSDSAGGDEIWVAAKGAEVDDPEGVEMTFDLGTGAVTDSTMPPSELVNNEGVQLSGAAAANQMRVTPSKRSTADALLADRDGSMSAMAPTNCRWLATNTYQGNRRESFVFVRGVLNAKAVLYQVRGSSHTLGIAHKSNDGGWGQSGTLTRSFENESVQGGIVGTKKYYNHVRYRKYTYTCGGSSWRPNNEQEAIAGHVVVPAQNYNHCTTHGKEYKFTKTNGKNATLSAGVDLSMINVSAQSGWNSTTKIKWSFTGRAKICWNDAGKGQEFSPHVIVKPA